MRAQALIRSSCCMRQACCGTCAGMHTETALPLLQPPFHCSSRAPCSPRPPCRTCPACSFTAWGVQAFASPQRVGEMVGKVREALRSTLPAAVARLKLYVRSPTTHAVLLRPIKSNIVEAHSQVATLLASEYTAEEVQAIHLPDPPELAALLDSLLG